MGYGARMTRSAFILACDDNFIPFTSTVARRAAALSGAPIFVISDGVTDENKKLARIYCPAINFIEAGELLDHSGLGANPHFPRSTFLRLFVDDLAAEFDRIAYLDSDISFLADPTPLLDMVPRAAPVIATYDMALMIDMQFRRRLSMSADAAYFNAGIMIMDLKAMRSEGTLKAARAFGLANPQLCNFADQDALNAVLDGHWQVLDWRWNTVNYMSNRLPGQPFIRHFAGNKPWNRKKVGVEQRFVDEWRADLEASPWSGRFTETDAKMRARAVVQPYWDAIENAVRAGIHGKSDGRRGLRVRLARDYARVMGRIEAAARDGELAMRRPEKALLG